MARKLVGSVVAVMLLASGASAGESAKQSRVPSQEESGTVIFPVPHPQDPNICFQGVARRLNMVSQGAISGPFGGIFDVDKATWGGKFKLDGKGVTGSEDLDLYFFQSFGPGIPDDPSMNAPTILQEYSERKAGGEEGTVPATATKAIVCLYSGFGANWTYKADPPAKKKKKKA